MLYAGGLCYGILFLEEALVVTSPLTHISIETLTQVLNEAFSNYEVPIHMSEAQLGAHLHALGYSPEDSIGLFDGNTLVGFILVAIRGTAAYDAGTGIIPSYQGNGYAHQLIEATLEHVKKRGVKSFILEVIDTNERAKTLYLRHGFSITRSLLCYQIQKDALEDTSSVRLQKQVHVSIPSGDCTPSWQNSDACIKRGGFTAYDIVHDSVKRGVLCFNPTKGSIAQIYIEPQYRRQGFAKQAIIAAKNYTETPTLGMLNITEDCVDINGLLTHMGFSVLLTQSEMIYTF
jgi:ribosomal protein S18 acetylase RimI-like enzyme